MEAQAAIAAAKAQVKSIFADEHIINVGLEELEFDTARGVWRVTIGFSRPWDTNFHNQLNNALNAPQHRRTYKIVSIDDGSGRFLGVANREVQTAA